MLVRELMTSPAVTVDEGQSATTVIRLLDRFHVSSLPVVDEKGQLVGIIGEADVIRDAAVLGEPVDSGWGTPPRACVRERMVSRVIGVDADTDVVDAVALMRRAALKSVPVLHKGRVVGMLSRSDVVRAAAERDRYRPSTRAGPSDARNVT
jgi:CBS domain-containing protein